MSYSERQLGQKTLENSSQRYDQDMLSKIGGPSTPSRTLGPALFANGAPDGGAPSQPRGSITSLNGQLKPLTMPSPGARRPSAPSSGAISPGFAGFRSPLFDAAPAPRRFSEQSSNYDDASTPIIRSARGSYDQNFQMDDDDSGMRDLNINDRSPGESDDYHNSKSGQKRRASSPPVEAAREDRPAASNGNDLYHRRSAQMLGNRSSPATRFHTSHGSVSSASSYGQRTNSYASSYGLSVASSATSYSSDRLSPGALSPTADGEYGPVSPYAASRSLNPSPRGSISTAAAAQQYANLSDHEPSQIRTMSTEGPLASRSIAGPVRRKPGVLLCDCCPKKPRKFDTEEKLR
jgi:hypothetical protein